MKDLWSGIVALIMAIIGIAILSVIISKKAQTVQVIQSAGSAFNSIVGTAVKPFTA